MPSVGGDLVLHLTLTGFNENGNRYPFPSKDFRISVINPDSSPFRPKPNPYQYGSPIQHSNLFFGRAGELQDMLSQLVSDTCQSVVVRGPRRTGKTSLLNMIEAIIKNEPGARARFQVVPEWEPRLNLIRTAFLDLSEIVYASERLDIELFFRTILRKIGLSLSLSEPRINEIGYHFDSLSGYTVNTRVKNALRLISQGLEPDQRVILLLDEFDRVAPHEQLLGNYLHSAYPPQLWPLRRDQAIEQILTQISEWAEGDGSNTVDETPAQLESGEVILPVGPVHASVIEPGRFYFRVAGDEIRDVQIKLGYTHKGVERLFQSSFSLRDGWRLAECIAADSAFAHSLAYCQAVESLTCVRVPCRAEYLRALFMELERIGNHIADVAAIAHDIASVLLASILAELREKMLRLNDRIAGHRLLRGLNRPGGIELKRPLSADDIWRTLREIGSKLREEGDYLIELAGFRDRAIGVGVLPEKLARDNGATGFVARASGLLERDFRLTHPYGLYRDEKYHRLLSEEAKLEKRMSTRSATGDVYARVVLRFEEAQISIKLIEHMLDDWLNLPEEELCNSIDRQLRATPNFATGLGYVEGWRGDIVYWVMKDKFDRIYRCKVRDPSTLNWPTLREAIIPRASGDPRTAKHTLLADFPLINKSFNLSYSGNDL